jgi:hypothetical protein
MKTQQRGREGGAGILDLFGSMRPHLGNSRMNSTLRRFGNAFAIAFVLMLISSRSFAEPPPCNEGGPYYGSWSVVSCPAINNTPGADPTTICQKVNTAPSKPKLTPPTYTTGQKKRTLTYDCSGPTEQTQNITFTVGAVQWDPALPGTITVAFSSTAYVNVTSSDPTLCPSPGRVNIATVTWNPVAQEMTSETVATTPTDRARTTIGVGEVVNLSIIPAPPGALTWTLSGSGSLSGSTYTASDRAGSATITAQCAGCNCGKWVKTFTVIEPSGVMIEQEPGTGVWHVQGTPSVGFKGRAYIQPDTVSFMNITVKEGEVAAACTGYFLPQNGQLHGEGSWIAFSSTVVAGKGTKDSAVDTIQGGDGGIGAPYSAGTFTWAIPWYFKVGAGAQKQFSTMNHVKTIDASGGLTISKGGTSKTKALNDPSSNY